MSWQDGDVEGNQRSAVGSIDSLFHDYEVLNMSISKARSVANNTITISPKGQETQNVT